MNDETREQLSAYLDGALTEAERLDLEARLAASAELRGALEDLRAVSRAVKDLPKEPLPPGFIARFQARRARGDAPRANWVFLPPQARPVVAALSIGVVALMIWDKVTVAPEPELLHPPESAKVYEAANAPVAQLNLSRAAGGAAAGSISALSDAKSLEIAGAAPKAARASDKLAYLEGGEQPAEEKPGVAAMRGSASGRAAGRPITPLSVRDPSALVMGPEASERAQVAMTEEERSARNEEMFGQLEKQKKKMGLKILPKSEDGEQSSGPGIFGLRRPAAPALSAPAPTLLQSAHPAGAVAAAASADLSPAAGPGRLAPDAGLVFTDARSVASSWVLLGLPGTPPLTDFANGRLVIIKPSATKILSVTSDPSTVTVVFRSLTADEESDPARDRVAPLPASPKTVLIYDASPR